MMRAIDQRASAAGEMQGRKANKNQSPARSAKQRNRPADQFCVYVVADERQIPVYAAGLKKRRGK